MTRMSGRAAAPAALVLLVLLAAGLPGCGGTSAEKTVPSIHGSGDEQAQRLFERLEREHAGGRHVQVIDLAHSLLDYHPDFPAMDEALALAVDSARRLGELDTARDLTDQRLARLGTSAAAAPLLLEASALAASAGDTLGAVDCLVRAAEADPAAVDARTLGGATPLFDALDSDQLGRLMAAHPQAPLRPYLGYERTRSLVAAGHVDEARAVVTELETSAPASRWTGEARAVLDNPRQTVLRARRLGPAAVRPDLIGVICPLTGRYAVLGNAFIDAALMAAAATERESGAHFELRIEDSGGDPVPAALAARRLVTEEGCLALLGTLTSAPTAAVALVADQWGVPLVSPTATSDRVWELGPGIFQTNLTGVYETRVLAELAVRVLLKRRFALLYPDSPEGERHAELFRAEVEAWGGEVVAVETFPERATDFRGPILAVREKRPEVIFVPASVDQMVLLGPQLDFHRAGSLVLGLSNFKSERLVERTGAVIEGVMFPDDLALFPPAWTAEFNEAWRADNYPREATSLALKTYQATRMMLDVIVQNGISERAQLTAALQRRLSNRDVDTDGPEPFARSVMLIRDGAFTAFPAGLFTEAWAMTEGAAADSLGAAAADSLSGTELFRE